RPTSCAGGPASWGCGPCVKMAFARSCPARRRRRKSFPSRWATRDNPQGDTRTMAIQMDDLLQVVVDEGASDLHIRVGVPPVIRLHGALVPMDLPVLVPEDTEAM